MTTDINSYVETFIKSEYCIYNKQIKNIGLSNHKKITSSSIFVIGSDHITFEICKNLILSGVNRIYLYEDNDIISEDTTYYLYTPYINSTKTFALYNFLNNINITSTILITDTIYNDQTCTLVVYKDIEYNKYINITLRNLNIPFINIIQSNNNNIIFTDVGNSFIIDNDVIDNNIIVIESINNNGIVRCTTCHNLENHNIITFNYIIGSDIDFLKKEWNIRTINSVTIQLLDFPENLNFIFINGSIIKKSIHTTLNHISLEEYINNNTSITNCNFKNNIMLDTALASLISMQILKILMHKYILYDQWYTYFETNNDIYNVENNILQLYTFVILGNYDIANELIKNILISNLCETIYIINQNYKLYENLLFIIKSYNSNVNIFYLKSATYEDISSIISTNTILLGCDDNIKNRKILNEIAIEFSIPYFDIGIENNMTSSQSIIPFKTETFIDFNTLSNEKIYPECVISNFPSNIYHCIEWAKQEYEKLFILKEYSGMIELEDIFNNVINQGPKKIIDVYKENHLMIDGSLYWSKGKIYPNLIKYNKLNNFHVTFANFTKLLLTSSITLSNDIRDIWIYYAVNLRATIYSIPTESYLFIHNELNNIVGSLPINAAFIASCVLLDVYELYKNNICYDRYNNIATNTFLKIPSKNAMVTSIHNLNYTIWNNFNYTENSTLNEFKAYYENMFKVDIFMILHKTTIIYADFLSVNINKTLDIILEEYNIQYYKPKFLLYSTENIDLPSIFINIKK